MSIYPQQRRYDFGSGAINEVFLQRGETLRDAVRRTQREMAEQFRSENRPLKATIIKTADPIDLIKINGVWMTPEDARMV